MLFSYLQQTQRFLRDGSQQLFDPGDLIVYVNRARREIAMRTQSIRVVPPISGQIVSASITAVGSGYVDPVVSIIPPDFPSGYPPTPQGLQATATASQIGGAIDSVNIEEGGAGYFEPIITITDATGPGTGALAVPVLTPMNLLLQGQEEYYFRDVNLTASPGVGPIYSIRSVSILYANYRYSLPCYSFSTYQAMVRQYPFQYQYVPTFMCQRGRGANGSVLFYPIPSQTYQMEWDAFCLPLDLATDQDYEALPEPWTDAVAYFAAHLCYLEIQSFNNARMMLELFDRQVGRYSAAALPGRVSNIYGRYIWAALAVGMSALFAGAGC